MWTLASATPTSLWPACASNSEGRSIHYALKDLIDDLRRDWQDEQIRRSVKMIGILLTVLVVFLFTVPAETQPW